MSYNIKNYNEIDERMVEYLESNDLWALRDRRSKKILNVSYSRDGLKWTVDNQGKLLYYRNAYLHLDSNSELPIIKGNTQLSNRVIVEKYVPINHRDNRLQNIEIRMLNKAYVMLYKNNFYDNF